MTTAAATNIQVALFREGHCYEITIKSTEANLVKGGVETCAQSGYTQASGPAFGPYAAWSKPPVVVATKPKVVVAKLMNLAGCTIAEGQVVNTTMANAHTLYGCENHG